MRIIGMIWCGCIILGIIMKDFLNFMFNFGSALSNHDIALLIINMGGVIILLILEIEKREGSCKK